MKWRLQHSTAATAAGGVLGKDDDALYFITLFLGHLASYFRIY
jgi:hypothetical protein